MKIFKDKLYLVRTQRHHLITGKMMSESRVMTGQKVRTNYRQNVIDRFDDYTHHAMFRLEDGSLPEFQPIVDRRSMITFLGINPFVSAFILG